jgi:hypothetical protein
MYPFCTLSNRFCQALFFGNGLPWAAYSRKSSAMIFVTLKRKTMKTPAGWALEVLAG